MSENNNSEEKQGRKFNNEQYQMLLDFSDVEDMAGWNEWREANREPLLLEGAEFRRGAYLRGADLTNARLKGAILREAKLKKAHLEHARLENADLYNAELKEAYFYKANLKDADLRYAKLEQASLNKANFKKADLTFAHLEGAELKEAHLEGAIFKGVAVDGKTLIWDCEDSQKTDFTGVGLDSARINPKLKERLKNNIRKMKWRDYCHAKAKKFEKKWPWYNFWKNKWCVKLRRSWVLLFWQISAYGSSTTEIVKWFWAWALNFALIYLAWGHIRPPGIIHNLMDTSPCLSAMRSIYFSVVTMTTLGFGDMHALKGSYAGYFFLSLQVLIGYALLGALIVRFGILFISSGPSQD